jgi:thioesterase domain-containing protein
MGGVVAYEMAQQLRAAGEPVGLLALLESWPPVTISTRVLKPGAQALVGLMVDRIRLYLRTFAQLHGRQRFDYLLERIRTITQILAQRDAFRGDRSELHLRLVMEANLLALRHYDPQVYPGRAVLFRAEGRKVGTDDDRRLAWQQLAAGGLEICTVPGDDSGAMLEEPHVRVVASRLQEYLGRWPAPPARAVRP